jgi:hypothetical protein
MTDALRQAVEALREAEEVVAEATRARDDRVRQAIADGVAVVSIAETTGLSKARVYQIRDHRR